MKTKEFKKYLDKAKKVINRSNTLPILDNVKFENGVLTVTDLEVTYSFKHEKFNGLNCLVEFEKLFKVISKLKDVDFDLTQEDEQFSVVTTKGKLNLRAQIDMNDYPTLPNGFNLIGKLTSEHLPLIKKALNYVYTDELRPVMTGVLLDKDCHIVGSDAHRLCFYKCAPTTDKDIILRPKVAIILDFEAEISESEKHTRFESENESIDQRNIDGNFPQWRQVIPQDNPNCLTVKANDLAERLELASITGNQASQLVRLELSSEGSKISSQDIDFDCSFESDLPSEYFGDDLDIGFKNPFMSQIIKTEKMETLSIRMSDPSRAMIINNEILLMPMALNS